MTEAFGHLSGWGPQGPEMASLLAREQALTSAERKGLLSDPSPHGQPFAPRIVRQRRNVRSRAAAWDAAKASGRGQVVHVAETANLMVTRDALAALAVRDLIGEYGFAAEDYDRLTLPWRCAVGSVHAGDDDMGLLRDPEEEFAVRHWMRRGLPRDAAVAAAALRPVVGVAPPMRFA